MSTPAHDYKYDRVLLVDDSKIDLLFQDQLIKTNQFARHVDQFSSAQEAIDYLKNPDNPAPEIIFLDIMMPVKDGFEFLEDFDDLPDEIKRKTKVVMLSNMQSFKYLNKANASPYVHKFLNKPLSKPVLEAINL